MPSFVDLHNRTWTVSITVGTLKRVRELIGVDLLDIVGKGKLLEKLIDEPETLVNVLYAVLQPQLAAANVTDVQFGESMAGDSLDAATTAFLEALTNFFPKAKRGVLTTAFRKFERLQDLAIEEATKRVEDPELETRFLATLGKRSMPWPESSESTPPH